MHRLVRQHGLAGRVADARGRHFLEIAGSTIRNVSQGVIGIAVLQSALLGIGMLVVGVPFAGAITFVALVLAIVQAGPGIVMLPEDRKSEGIVPNLSVRDNIVLAALPKLSSAGFTSRRKQDAVVDVFIIGDCASQSPGNAQDTVTWTNNVVGSSQAN